MPAATRPSWWGGVPRTLALPAVVAFLTFGSTAFAALRQPYARPLDVLGVVLLVIGPAALVVRRAYPREVVVLAAAAVVVWFGLGYPGSPMPAAAVIALFGATVAGHHHVAAITAATSIAVLAVWTYVAGGTVSWPGVLIVLAWLTVVVAAGVLWRFRRERREQVRAALAEEQRRKAGEERLRIAQELHDVLGHHVSLINVQAGVALFLLDDDPEQARTALAEIKRSSRDLLREMRSTLGVLRGVDAAAPHQPTPGLDRLDALLDDVRAAGLEVTLRTAGDTRPLPTGVDLAAYRIVQESLTNTRRHAGASTATVLIGYRDRELELRVDDDGTGPPAVETTGGNGLLGMTERAHALGGTLEAGAGPDGGYRVRARLPLPEPAEAVVETGDATVRR
ncbi:sensor histidine kinase [Pseudonocardia endophytica]|uniref:sensor histidine kinase n=1 Tax=Pseudonocardia endophytica TaxID=401976 RepID=UPI0010473DAB|nr:sensor histidine kinase [Pseudonocardia endophytica]